MDEGKAECQTASRPGGGCRGLQVGGAGGASCGYGRGSQHGWFSTLVTLRPWHSRRCRNSRSVLEKFFKTQNAKCLLIQIKERKAACVCVCCERADPAIPAGTAHTGKASPHCGHACVSPGGSAE